MTVFVAIALVITPPVEPHQEAPQWLSNRPAPIAAIEASTSSWYIVEPPVLPLSPLSSAEIGSPVALDVSPIPPPPEPPTLRERALNRLVELGAAPWQIGVFDCIGWHESNWRNVRNHQSGDDGVFQISDIHDPQLRAQGLDPYVPEDAATFAWQLSRQGSTFKPWVVAPLCVRAA
jgi:hypothetical protein